MAANSRDGQNPQSSLPIPTYEEAIASRPSSSASFLGPSEVSHDAERQGLLSRNASNYQPPTVESARSSADFLASSDGGSVRLSDESLRREVFEVDDSGVQYGESSQMGTMLAKRISSLRSGLSSLHLPIRNYFSNFRRPSLPEGFTLNPILIVRIFAFFLVVGLAYLIFFSDLLNWRRGMRTGMSAPISDLRHHLKRHINETRIRDNLIRATNYGHVAGTKGGYAVGKWIEESMLESGLEQVRLEQFDVYLNWPNKEGRKLEIRSPKDKAFTAVLEEDDVYHGTREQEYVFHGHSKSGNATGHLVYANYGSREDFQTLDKLGISVQGAVVLVRYYGSQGDRALKIKAAQEAGAVGCVIYSDPAEDGFTKGKTWPDGPWRPDDSVQRGGVSLMSWVVGDPLSPGFASLPEEEKRLLLEDNPGLPKIPSLPISWRDAEPLLKALKGHGKKMEGYWVGANAGTERWTGSEDGPTVYLANNLDEEERHPIYNVLGKITGLEQPEHPIIIGTHHDAWCFGAVDPGSGTAIFLELVRLFGGLKRLGWRPRRTIEFASWDGEEYNMIGSTEHVENRIDDLRKNAFAYINVDTAVSGSDFNAAGSPVLEEALLGVLNHVMHPTSTVTMRKWWSDNKKKYGGLGSGSDYVAFQDLAGTSSIDLSFSGEKYAYPYHSCYETFEWVERFADPGFQIHKTMAEIWSLLTLELADEPLLPMDLTTYTKSIDTYIGDLSNYADSKKSKGLDVSGLHDANLAFKSNADKFHEYDQQWRSMVESTGGFESTVMTIDRLKYNRRVAHFESDLLDLEGGLPGREQFKHVIFAPQAWSGYNEAYFPGPRDAIDADDWKGAQNQVDKVARILRNASESLLR